MYYQCGEVCNLYFQNASGDQGGGGGMVRILASFLCSVDHVGCFKSSPSPTIHYNNGFCTRYVYIHTCVY